MCLCIHNGFEHLRTNKQVIRVEILWAAAHTLKLARHLFQVRYFSWKTIQSAVGRSVGQSAVGQRSVSQSAASLCNAIIEASSLRNHYDDVKI